MKIVIDMMGGDNGLEATLPAVQSFKAKHPEAELVLSGDASKIPGELGEVIDAPKALPMETKAMEAFRDKESSMAKAVLYAAENKADAVISAGGTAAFLSLCTLRLKKMEGIERPALVADFPTLKRGKKVTLLDIGASNVNTAKELSQFGLIGSLYHSAVHGVESPEVYLLSNGTEEGKGRDEVVEAHKILKEEGKVNFKGNIEAREVMLGEADVIVCDGYSGNVLLKSTEGTAKAMSALIKRSFKKNILTKIGYLFARGGFKEMSRDMDYKNTGGALLLGINAVSVKAHGNSDPKGFESALEVAYKAVSGNLNQKIKEKLGA